MFTGIIDHCGVITKIENLKGAKRIWLSTHFQNLELGESITVDGICLTVAQFTDTIFCVDLSPETLRVTTAANFTADQHVNLERALLLSSRLGGHMVTGHVDQVCQIKSINSQHEFIEMEFSGLDETNKKYIVKKGSVAINGVSLTINAVSLTGFTVMLISHTLARTNLSLLQQGDTVNVEFDMMARIIVQHCQAYFS